MLGMLSVVMAAETVDLPGDADTLAQAVALVDDGGTILLGSDYDGRDEGGVLIRKPLTVKGTGQHLPPIGVLDVEVTLEGITLGESASSFEDDEGFGESCPHAACGVVVNKGFLILTDVTIQGVDATTVLALESSTTLTNVTIEDSGNNFTVLLSNTFATGVHTFTTVRYAGNTAALVIASSIDGTTASLTDVTFEDLSEGALKLSNVDASLTQVTVQDSDSEAQPAIRLEGGSLVAGGLDVTTVTAPYGGAIQVSGDGSLSWTGGTVTNVHAQEQGGVLNLLKGNATLQNLEVSDVSAPEGGFAWVGTDGTVTVRDTVLDTVTGTTGGVFLLQDAANIEMRHVTVCDPTGHGALFNGSTNGFFLRNVVVQDSHGQLIQAEDGSRADLQNVTLVGDGAAAGIGGSFQELQLVNTILTRFTKGTVLSEVSQGNQSYNLWWDNQIDIAGQGGVGDGDVFANPDFDNYDPDVCGSMPKLSDGSLAIDAGHPDVQDTDGSRSDIGAMGGTDGVDPKTNQPTDTGDPKDTDTGVVDSDPPHDSGGPSGFTLGQASGGCGHAGGGGALMAMALLLWRRRCSG